MIEDVLNPQVFVVVGLCVLFAVLMIWNGDSVYGNFHDNKKQKKGDVK